MKNRLAKFATTGLFAIALLSIVAPAHAGNTINQFELTVSGGNTVNLGASSNVKLFLDRDTNSSEFWVRYVNNPGTPPNSETPLPSTVSIKYFPISRYVEILRAARDIRQFGVVNRELDGSGICDIPASAIRIWNRTVTLVGTCGGTGVPITDESALDTERLIVALLRETADAPDLSGTKP